MTMAPFTVIVYEPESGYVWVEATTLTAATAASAHNKAVALLVQAFQDLPAEEAAEEERDLDEILDSVKVAVRDF